MCAFPGNMNICVDCKNAFGGCSWTMEDPQTNKTAFIPVPGWTAEKSYIGHNKKGKYREVIESYHITSCPKFVRG